MTLSHFIPRASLVGAFVLALSACDSAALDDIFAADDASLDGPLVVVSTEASNAALNGDECTGLVGAVTVEKIIVPDGASCRLEGTRVQSDVEVKPGASLIARRAIVGGNVQASNARSVQVILGRVDGNVQLEQGRGGLVRRVVIGGDLQVEQNSRAYTLDRNRIDGNLQAFQNRGGLTIQGNQIQENLQCKENVPPPTGGGNTAASKEDQCALL